MWFPLSPEKSAQTETKGAISENPDTPVEASWQFPLKRATTGDFSSTQPAALTAPPTPPAQVKAGPAESAPSKASTGASEVVFLDPDWLMGCIKMILDQDLLQDILSTDSYHVM
jgi:hypothetical protein